jgi:hypothetical protein
MRFYGQSIQVVLRIHCAKPVAVATADLGTDRSVLKSVASLLGISVGKLAIHTVIAV